MLNPSLLIAEKNGTYPPGQLRNRASHARVDNDARLVRVSVRSAKDRSITRRSAERLDRAVLGQGIVARLRNAVRPRVGPGECPERRIPGRSSRVVHAALDWFRTPDSDPPCIPHEGWAMAQCGDERLELAQAAADLQWMWKRRCGSGPRGICGACGRTLSSPSRVGLRCRSGTPLFPACAA